MTSDLTTREVSKRLKDVGFESSSTKGYPIRTNGIIDNMLIDHITYLHKWHCDGYAFLPAYSASTLFEYLRENRYDFWFYCDIGVTGFRIDVGRMEAIQFEHDPETSLADMLAEAILFILEKENK